MTPLQQLQYEALKALKEYQDSHDSLVIKGAGILGPDYTKTLIDSGYLEQVIKGWYIPSDPSHSGNSTAWYISYWDFIAAYMESRFGDQWSLSPDQSLLLHGGDRIIPTQLIVRSPSASNNITQLPHGCSIVDIKAAIPSVPAFFENGGIRVYSLEESLLLSSADTYRKHATEAGICLAAMKDESNLIALVTEGVGPSRIGRVAGALRAVGKPEMADRLKATLPPLGIPVREENPFEKEITVPRLFVSPYASRIEMLWREMKQRILAMEKASGLRPKDINKADILADMEKNYIFDSYNSLSIEGYKVSPELLERVRGGRWNPKDVPADKDTYNALAARGYYQAYTAVRESIRAILEGADPGDAYARDYRSWRFQLFEPGVRAGILKPSDLAGFRNHPVYIKNSMHTPVGEHAVIDCMAALDELMRKENSALVRGILGHFFFTYIHPYMDGNGRTARFVMNSQLCTAGYGWVVIRDKDREEYMRALESASVKSDIEPFAGFIMTRIKQGLSQKEELSLEDVIRRRHEGKEVRFHARAFLKTGGKESGVLMQYSVEGKKYTCVTDYKVRDICFSKGYIQPSELYLSDWKTIDARPAVCCENRVYSQEYAMSLKQLKK